MYYFILSAIMALWEIEIEGVAGWASNLPTKKYFRGDRVIWTNYHTYFALFTFMLFHQVFLYQEWNFVTERKVLSEYIKFFVVEDTLWFALNKQWKKQNNKDWWREPKVLDTIPVFYFPVLLLSYLMYSENWIFQSGVDFCLVMMIDWLV